MINKTEAQAFPPLAKPAGAAVEHLYLSGLIKALTLLLN